MASAMLSEPILTYVRARERAQRAQLRWSGPALFLHSPLEPVLYWNPFSIRSRSLLEPLEPVSYWKPFSIVWVITGWVITGV